MLFFFSGLHSDYHKPSDTWDKINAPRCRAAAGHDRKVALELDDSSRGNRSFVTVARERKSARRRRQRRGGGGGYGPYFGSIPDFGQIGKRRALQRRAAEFARRKGGAEGRRRAGAIRRQKDPQSLRFHRRAARPARSGKSSRSPCCATASRCKALREARAEAREADEREQTAIAEHTFGTHYQSCSCWLALAACLCASCIFPVQSFRRQQARAAVTAATRSPSPAKKHISQISASSLSAAKAPKLISPRTTNT